MVPRYGLITEEEAKAAERYDALMEHSEAIANAPKKQTEARPVVCFEGDLCGVYDGICIIMYLYINIYIILIYI